MAPLLRRTAPLMVAALLASACDDPAPTTGTMVVTVTGLPTTAEASVRVTGPNQFFQLVRATTTIENLQPGGYFVIRDPVQVSGDKYAPPALTDSVHIVAGRTENVAAGYQIASGSIALTINGLPSGVAGSVRVRGPLPSATYNVVHTTSGTIAGLDPGTYEIVSDPMQSFFGDRYIAGPASQTVTVSASATPVNAAVNYAIASGTLEVVVTGLPQFNSVQSVTVAGPNNYLVRLAQSQVLRGLDAGTYNISAANINGTCPDIFTTFNTQQSREVTIGTTASATVTYSQSAASPADLNLKIDKVILTQATQNSAGTVPIITGKPALIRVFAIANQCNTAKPKVRVTTSTGFVELISAQEDSVRLLNDESRLSATWNATLPASAIQAGMTIVAELDPANEVAEANEGDNRFPASGGKSIDVRTVPTIGVRLVPITQTVNNNTLTGAVTSANADLYMEWSKKLHPVSNYDVVVREPYTTTAGALGASGTNWSQVLSEINGLRSADTSARYYYGIARVTYNSGVAGVAFVPGKAGMGWDYLPSGSRIMAHEMGHSFGRLHAPCGGPAGLDPDYPSTPAYANGRIGVFGWDPFEGLKSNELTDVMGYCNSQWISDYMYMGMLDYLMSPNRGPTLPSQASEQPSLLVWGRIENGQPILEPAFEISARPRSVAPGPHRLMATDATGAEIFSVSFAGERIADLPGNPESFAFTIPLSALRGRTLASLKLTALGKTVSSVASGDVASDPAVTVTRLGSRAARIRWDATRFPVVMVRNPATGNVISFARGGDATITTGASQLDLNFSNRVRSTRRVRELK